MPRPLVTRTLGIAVVSLAVVGLGVRSTLWAGQPPAALVAANATGGGFGGAEEDKLGPAPVVHLAARPMSPEAMRIWMKLQDKVAMNFPNETPLEDVLKYIRQTTKDKEHFPEGIPVYVDPVALQEVEKTPSSPVTMDLAGIPLATTLRLALKQIGLTYRIETEGFLSVCSLNDAESPIDADGLILDNLSALRAEVKALREEIQHHRVAGMPGGANPNQPAPAGGMGGGMR